MNEWTSIKDGPPTFGVPLIVTIWDAFEKRRALRYPVYYRKSMYQDRWGFYLYANEESQLLPDCSEVLAWMEVPKIWEGSVGE